MESIREIFRIGNGPSSSHTMGPMKAAEMYKERFEHLEQFRATLYGSLAATGKGHLTDWAIKKVFEDKQLEIVWEPETFLPEHPNGMKFEVLDGSEWKHEWTAFSIGGGAVVDNIAEGATPSIYPLTTMDEILKWCYDNGKQIWEFVEAYEPKEVWSYLEEVWEVMKNAIERGLDAEGTLPGVIKYPRKAASYYTKARNFERTMKKRSMVYAFALAVSEENAGGGKIVTAPTCGACGVVPSVLFHMQKYEKISDVRIIRALATAGLIGTLVKKNASISGAEVGCQGEVGTACAMASAAATQLSGGSIFQIEYAAEMGLEHHLGLTCDPIAGLVQVPCIERNAFAAARALSHKNYAMLSDGRHMISFDKVTMTMKQTGDDLPHLYKETSEGGLAHFHGIKS